MIPRRRLLAGGLILSVGLCRLQTLQAASAEEEVQKFCYATRIGLADNRWEPNTDFTIYASRDEAQVLQRAPGRIGVRLPYLPADRRRREESYITGALDRGFNGNGYRFKRGNFGIRVPGP